MKLEVTDDGGAILAMIETGEKCVFVSLNRCLFSAQQAYELGNAIDAAAHHLMSQGAAHDTGKADAKIKAQIEGVTPSDTHP